jgi:hypothetical protein
MWMAIFLCYQLEEETGPKIRGKIQRLLITHEGNFIIHQDVWGCPKSPETEMARDRKVFRCGSSRTNSGSIAFLVVYFLCVIWKLAGLGNKFVLFCFVCGTRAWTQGFHLEPLHQPYFLWRVFQDRVSWIHLPRLALNCDLPDPCLLSS